MKVLIIGLGSMGRRYLRLLKEMKPVEIIGLKSSRKEIDKKHYECHGIKLASDIHQAVGIRPDFAIISNPTSLHVESALVLAETGIPFLIEKPVSDNMDRLDVLLDIVKEKSLKVMVGFQLRQHPGYKRVKKIIKSGDIGKPLSLQGYVGQYLPDWRPNADYKQTSSARKDLGGGVILDLCHEIDIAISLLGSVARLSCFCDHYSNLEINTEDLADIILVHKDGCQSHIHLNYLERNYAWTTRITGDKGTVIWDYGKGFVELTLPGDKSTRWEDPEGFERDDLFRAQLCQWFNVLESGMKPSVELQEGIEVTRVAVSAKISSQERRYFEL
jgi:predicted dehydrogenase